MTDTAPTAPRWLRVLAGVAFTWMGVWFFLSLISSMGVSCSTEECQDRADTGWLVLMGLQIAWAVLAVVAWLRPRFRYLGLAVAVGLPPATFLLVTRIFYPEGFSL